MPSAVHLKRMQQHQAVIQLKLNFTIRDNKEIIIVALLANRKGVTHIVGKPYIKFLFFNVVLLKITDDRAVLFKVNLIQRQDRSNSVKNSVI